MAEEGPRAVNNGWPQLHPASVRHYLGNYGSWAIVGLLFGLVVERRQWDWWRRYNFVLSSALDFSVAIAGIVIFFALFYTGASKNFKWWGTEVHRVHCSPLPLLRE